tara:strand:+ start:388 stop:861 length:474 start_codon:yes stop_codon:yes gene_type:complete
MDKKTQETMFSSKSNEWGTPQAFFDELDKQYTFTLDPCATASNAKCRVYFTEDTDGLEQSWEGHSVFMNPPYGREISKWIKKAYEEGRKDNTRVVCLIPARTDTKYWHEYCMRADQIFFVRGRLKFGNSKNSAPFPSAVVVFGGCALPPSIGALVSK